MSALKRSRALRSALSPVVAIVLAAVAVIPVAQGGSAVSAASTVELQVAGRGGVPADASAAVLSLTATNASAAGWAIAWPCGTPRPATSNLNYRPGADVSNSAIVELDAEGRVCIDTSVPADLVVDVAGAFPGWSTDRFVATRLLDTRSENRRSAGSTVEVQVAGRGGVPANAVAAVLNLTATDASAAGWAIAWPCGTPRPATSSLNYRPGADVSNAAIVELDAGGRVCIHTSGPTDLIVDLVGDLGDEAGYMPLRPARLLDTRSAVRVAAGSTIVVPVGGRANVPSTAAAAVLNITATRATEAGWITVWPCGVARPETSTLSYRPGVDVASMAFAALGESGEVCAYASRATDLIVDLVGTLPGDGRYVPVVPSRLLDTRDGSPPPGQPPAPAPAPARFSTLPVGAELPSGEECAGLVRAAAENKPVNVVPNRVTGTTANGRYPRVDGNFTGTTDEILQWVACKWGIDEDVVRAQAVTESWWRQDTRGDLTHDRSACHPTLRTTSGQCGESVGIMQVRYRYHSEAFEDENAIQSTAYNADYAYAFWRACFEGEFDWLNHVERGATYSAGDARGCLGVWFSGRWYTSAAVDYMGKVDGHRNGRTWEQAYFQNA